MTQKPSTRSTRLGVTLVEILVALAIIAVLIGLLLPAVMRARGQAAGVRCQNNLRQLAIAFQSHHADHGEFPSGGWEWATPPNYPGGRPAAGRKQQGGWGFQVLPYVEARSVWEAGPRAAIATALPVFFCPVRREPQTITYPDEYLPSVAGSGQPLTHGLCDYAASNLTGTGAVRQFDPVRIADVTDGTTSTLLLAEKRMNVALLGIPQPDDNEGYTAGFDEDTIRSTEIPPLPDFTGMGGAGQRFGGPHTGVVYSAFCDGSVRPVSYNVSSEVFSRLGNRSDGQTVALD